MTELSLPESRLRGDLARRHHALGNVVVRQDVDRNAVVAEALPGVTGEAQESRSVLDGRGTLVVGAEIAGLWHYSPGKIDQFTRDKAEKASGKFGNGTYFGVGELAGETVDGLKSNGSVRHDAGFRGNVLAVDRSNVRDVVADLRALNGLSQPTFRSSIQNGPITNLVETPMFEGHAVDAVMVYMDPERQTAEMIVLPRATENITITT